MLTTKSTKDTKKKFKSLFVSFVLFVVNNNAVVLRAVWAYFRLSRIARFTAPIVASTVNIGEVLCLMAVSGSFKP